ncbi:MAG: hypothetical protein IH931_08830, partial [candidate division Zixibacteria bacterium]|nr:hypothetical protein [candidate division Zixibacteria bacterium]
CGYKPIKSCRLLDSSQGQFESTLGRGNPFWDSAYFFMSLPDGSETSQGTGGADQQFMATFIEHDFGPNETLTFAVAHFGISSGVTDPSAAGGGGEISALANLVNKWVGFGRGDVDDDQNITIADIMTIVSIVSGSVLGAIPFEHLADVNADGAVDGADVTYLVDYYFNAGPCPAGDWTL